MRIVDIIERRVPLEGAISNAVVSFTDHDVSLVAVVSDVVRNGRPLIGYGFNSIGRYAQRGILEDRIIPRLKKAAPDALLDETGEAFDPAKVLAVALTNEKPGGHGDRAGAIGAVELAFWDLNAKLADEPACATIARAAGRGDILRQVPVYAAGGYYYPHGSGKTLTDELRGYRDLGFDAFKIKIGGAPMAADLKRIEEALAIAGSGQRLSVDANGRFDIGVALDYGRAIEGYDLRWYEEVGDPLDYDLNRQLTELYAKPVATGENLFSRQDVKNLLLFGGLRPNLDIFQMDAGLSYGLTEYMAMLDMLEQAGFDRAQAFPHGGHLINLHIAAGLGLGGCEAYPGVFLPFGGYPAACPVGGGTVSPTDAPGFGLEQKPEIAAVLKQLCQ